MVKIDSLVEKIQGLFRLSEDKRNDNECQSALLLAQKLMLKHNISMSDLEHERKESEGVDRKSSFDQYKTLYWWEKTLAYIISENFRCKHYISRKILNGEKRAKGRFVFIGLKEDVKIASEVYYLAHESIVHHTDIYMKQFAIDRRRKKSAYMRGFVEGVEKKLDEQRFELVRDYGIMVLTPKIVEDEYEKLNLKSGNSYRKPSLDSSLAKSYSSGFDKGNSIDFTKSTIDK